MFQFSNIHNADNPILGSNIRGEYGETAVSSLFIALGFRVCQPQTNWYPYDLLIERHQKMFRVQVKTVDSAPKQKPYPRSWFSQPLEFDWACILAGDGSTYLIPKQTILEDFTEEREGSYRFTLYPKHERFKIAEFHGFSILKAAEDILND